MPFRFLRPAALCVATSVAGFLTYAVLYAAIAIPTGSPYSQTFDGMGVPANATTASALPADFRVDNPSVVRTVGSFAAAVATTARAGGANLSTSAANGVYSFGAGTAALGNADRAVGFLSSGSATASGNLYAQLVNNTGASLTGLQVGYSVEKYRGGSNPAGFRVQLFYSTDGVSWTSAGAAFTTSFAADATNNGFATAPGATVPVNAALSVPIANGATFYLAWNYSVSSSATTTNAQALAVDDISITGVGGGDDAPGVTGTTPAAGAANVALDSNVVVNFSESVDATSSAFSLVCNSLPQAFSQGPSSGVTSITLDPIGDLPAGANCTVTVAAAQVTDTDATDPPDQMAADYAFAFTTEGAPSVTATAPANGATGVGLNAAIGITFSESVSAAFGAFEVQCPAGTPQTFTQTTSPAAAFTLTPSAPLPAATSCTVTVHAAQISDTDANDPPDAMAADYTFSFSTANAPPPGAGSVVINEVDADTPGADAAEFVELYDGGSGLTPLDGLVVVFYNGSDDKVYAAFDLDGHTTNGSGYFTLGNSGVSGVDLVFDPGANGLLQNGADAVALYAGNASDFPVGADLTTANLQDAIVYDTDDADDAGLLVLLNADQPQVNENGGGSGQTQSSQRCPNGAGGFRNTSTYQQGSPTPGAANSCVTPPPPNNSDVVISQIYGGGGNQLATYQNDYVELYNKGTATVDLTGWSLQYTSASGSAWDFTRQPLGGPIGPGEYLLVSLAGGATGAALPPANILGQINMSASNGKVALVDTFEPLVGNCPTLNPHLMDLVGYGSADCREGATTAPSPGNNTTAIFRLGNGATDTNQNGNDFVKGAPNPRRTAPIVELGPMVLGTDPRTNGVNAPRDATILVTFTEPVDVVDPWFTLTCVSSGSHTSATFAVNGGGRDRYITPNDGFTAGEQCTVTVLKDQIHDQDLDDSGPNTDTLPANYSWSFTVSSGTAPPFPSSVHLTLGNPSGASTSDPDDYLLEKPEFTLSYNRDMGRPNWVSWHLSTEWTGTLTRVDTFRPDPAVPPDWYRVQSFDFSNTGFDRGHMVPNADRDKETSIPINQSTFLMSNMVAQAPDNNQGPWAALEGYLRTLVDAGSELYVVAGPGGTGGSGSNGGLTTTVAGGHVTVPAFTWKVALVIPAAGGDDVSRVDCSSRTIAVVMPNVQGIRTDPWENYLTTVDAVESMTGLNLFSNLPSYVQACVEAGLNGNNPKNSQTISFEPIGPHTIGDADFVVDATASSGLPVRLSVLSGPATISGGTVHLTGVGTVIIRASQGGDVNYDPAPDVDRAFEVGKATPVFSALSSPSIEAGGGTTSVAGTIGGTPFVPTGTVRLTLGTQSVDAPIDPAGGFLATFATAALSPAGSPYAIAVSYAGDASFNAASASTTLTVADTIAPVIVLNGPSPMSVELGTPFVDPGATASDSFAGNLTAAIQTTGAVNTAVAGSYTRTYTVSDGYNTTSVARTVTVVDRTGPVIRNLAAVPDTLFFPTNTLWPVLVLYTATDASGTPVCSLGVTSNNPASNQGHGIGSIDWFVLSPHLVLLRAERAPRNQPALVYTITVTCTDTRGNSSSAQTTVAVRQR